MNSGMADAVAVACREPSRATAAVGEFAAVRRAAAVCNSAAAGAALAHLRPRRWGRVRQRVAATLAPVVPRCGAWLEHAPYGPRHGPPGASPGSPSPGGY